MFLVYLLSVVSLLQLVVCQQVVVDDVNDAYLNRQVRAVIDNSIVDQDLDKRTNCGDTCETLNCPTCDCPTKIRSCLIVEANKLNGATEQQKLNACYAKHGESCCTTFHSQFCQEDPYTNSESVCDGYYPECAATCQGKIDHCLDQLNGDFEGVDFKKCDNTDGIKDVCCEELYATCLQNQPKFVCEHKLSCPKTCKGRIDKCDKSAEGGFFTETGACYVANPTDEDGKSCCNKFYKRCINDGNSEDVCDERFPSCPRTCPNVVDLCLKDGNTHIECLSIITNNVLYTDPSNCCTELKYRCIVDTVALGFSWAESENKCEEDFNTCACPPRNCNTRRQECKTLGGIQDIWSKECYTYINNQYLPDVKTKCCKQFYNHGFTNNGLSEKVLNDLFTDCPRTCEDKAKECDSDNDPVTCYNALVENDKEGGFSEDECCEHFYGICHIAYEGTEHQKTEHCDSKFPKCPIGCKGTYLKCLSEPGGTEESCYDEDCCKKFHYPSCSTAFLGTPACDLKYPDCPKNCQTRIDRCVAKGRSAFECYQWIKKKIPGPDVDCCTIAYDECLEGDCPYGFDSIGDYCESKFKDECPRSCLGRIEYDLNVAYTNPPLTYPQLFAKYVTEPAEPTCCAVLSNYLCSRQDSIGSPNPLSSYSNPSLQCDQKFEFKCPKTCVGKAKKKLLEHPNFPAPPSVNFIVSIFNNNCCEFFLDECVKVMPGANNEEKLFKCEQAFLVQYPNGCVNPFNCPKSCETKITDCLLDKGNPTKYKKCLEKRSIGTSCCQVAHDHCMEAFKTLKPNFNHRELFCDKKTHYCPKRCPQLLKNCVDANGNMKDCFAIEANQKDSYGNSCCEQAQSYCTPANGYPEDSTGLLKCDLDTLNKCPRSCETKFTNCMANSASSTIVDLKNCYKEGDNSVDFYGQSCCTIYHDECVNGSNNLTPLKCDTHFPDCPTKCPGLVKLCVDNCLKNPRKNVFQCIDICACPTDDLAIECCPELFQRCLDEQPNANLLDAQNYCKTIASIAPCAPSCTDKIAYCEEESIDLKTCLNEYAPTCCTEIYDTCLGLTLTEDACNDLLFKEGGVVCKRDCDTKEDDCKEALGNDYTPLKCFESIGKPSKCCPHFRGACVEPESGASCDEQFPKCPRECPGLIDKCLEGVNPVTSDDLVSCLSYIENNFNQKCCDEFNVKCDQLGLSLPVCDELFCNDCEPRGCAAKMDQCIDAKVSGGQGVTVDDFEDCYNALEIDNEEKQYCCTEALHSCNHALKNANCDNQFGDCALTCPGKIHACIESSTPKTIEQCYKDKAESQDPSDIALLSECCEHFYISCVPGCPQIPWEYWTDEQITDCNKEFPKCGPKPLCAARLDSCLGVAGTNEAKAECYYRHPECADCETGAEYCQYLTEQHDKHQCVNHVFKCDCVPPPVVVGEPGACTYTQGYWKNHDGTPRQNGQGPRLDDTWLKLGPDGSNTSFLNKSPMTWKIMFDTPPSGGRKWYQIAHQWGAVHLNLLQFSNPVGAIPSALIVDGENVYALAKLLLENNSPDLKNPVVPSGSALDVGKINEVLTWFNEGSIGPGHCRGEVVLL